MVRELSINDMVVIQIGQFKLKQEEDVNGWWKGGRGRCVDLIR